MQIKDMGYEIKDVPGVERIQVFPSETYGHGVAVVVEDETGVGVEWDLNRFTEYVAALNRAVSLAEAMARAIKDAKDSGAVS